MSSTFSKKTHLLTAPPLGRIRQVAYIVKDLHRAMTHWIDLGVGPWFYRPRLTSTEYSYHGIASQPPILDLAFANSGNLQIELIQQLNDVPSLYLDTLMSQGEVAQHVAYWTVDSFPLLCQRLLSLGYQEGHRGRNGAGRGAYAYFYNTTFPATMIEISELTGGKAEFFKLIRESAENWDGSDPVRTV